MIEIQTKPYSNQTRTLTFIEDDFVEAMKEVRELFQTLRKVRIKHYRGKNKEASFSIEFTSLDQAIAILEILERGQERVTSKGTNVRSDNDPTSGVILTKLKNFDGRRERDIIK